MLSIVLKSLCSLYLSQKKKKKGTQSSQSVNDTSLSRFYWSEITMGRCSGVRNALHPFLHTLLYPSHVDFKYSQLCLNLTFILLCHFIIKLPFLTADSFCDLITVTPNNAWQRVGIKYVIGFSKMKLCDYFLHLG